MSKEARAPFTAEDAAAAWDAGADAFDAFVESGEDFYRIEVHGPGLLAACGDIRGLRVLDLGCGQGYFCRQLADRGAQVVGVDVSPGQIGHARRHEAERPLGIVYEVMDAAQVGEQWNPGDFDLVTSCMAIHDTADPARVLASAASLLRPGQRLVYSAPNPTTDPPYREWERDSDGRKLALKIDRYFDTGPKEMDWNMPRLEAHWRTPMVHSNLSEMTAMIDDAGLLIRRIHEPRPTDEQVKRRPKLDDCARLPYFLLFDCVKSQPQRA
jgi:2-polyprenyl-3-methyl-5-hydroxy-6-metoxy-1,4-benzoquinol methylase